MISDRYDDRRSGSYDSRCVDAGSPITHPPRRIGHSTPRKTPKVSALRSGRTMVLVENVPPMSCKNARSPIMNTTRDPNTVSGPSFGWPIGGHPEELISLPKSSGVAYNNTLSNHGRRHPSLGGCERTSMCVRPGWPTSYLLQTSAERMAFCDWMDCSSVGIGTADRRPSRNTRHPRGDPAEITMGRCCLGMSWKVAPCLGPAPPPAPDPPHDEGRWGEYPRPILETGETHSHSIAGRWISIAGQPESAASRTTISAERELPCREGFDAKDPTFHLPVTTHAGAATNRDASATRGRWHRWRSLQSCLLD
jgi:hypothetical protein